MMETLDMSKVTETLEKFPDKNRIWFDADMGLYTDGVVYGNEQFWNEVHAEAKKIIKNLF